MKALPWLLGSLIIIGLICLIYGGIKWHNIQKEIDEQTKLKTREQEANLRKLTTSEIAVKVIDEVANDCENQENSTEIINNTMLRRHTVVKAIEIEDLCYSYISKKYSMDYDIHQNIRINNHDCDIIAISKKNKIDYLFEVKYWNKIPSSVLLLRAMTLIDELNISYESNSNRKCKCVLMIVTIDEIKEKLKEFCDLYASKYSAPIDIKIYKESDLK